MPQTSNFLLLPTKYRVEGETKPPCPSLHCSTPHSNLYPSTLLCAPSIPLHAVLHPSAPSVTLHTSLFLSAPSSAPLCTSFFELMLICAHADTSVSHCTTPCLLLYAALCPSMLLSNCPSTPPSTASLHHLLLCTSPCPLCTPQCV